MTRFALALQTSANHHPGRHRMDWLAYIYIAAFLAIFCLIPLDCEHGD